MAAPWSSSQAMVLQPLQPAYCRPRPAAMRRFRGTIILGQPFGGLGVAPEPREGEGWPAGWGRNYAGPY